MRSVLEGIRATKGLRLQIVATGMHLDRSRGRTAGRLSKQGFAVDAIVPWVGARGAAELAERTGAAMSGLARAYRKLGTDIVLVVGDRVEAFAAAAAGNICGLCVAHVHGGDRAMGQVDDALRHAISKLSHLHFPATKGAARRLRRMGEQGWRIFRCGSPAVDGIRGAAAEWREVKRGIPGLRQGRYALFVLHPTEADEGVEAKRARMLLHEVMEERFDQVVAIYPNNDPGSGGIVRELERRGGALILRRDVDRGIYLGLLRDAAVLVGNSSSGIIEAPSFGTPVLDVGPRQRGRERDRSVVHVEFEGRTIRAALRRLWDGRRARRRRIGSVYGGGGAGRKIAGTLSRVRIDGRLLRKLIDY
jgi:GDP/UDP-N,N'-diacetylbacillosamine 2-epimerase (hydrolysing)